MAVTRLLLAMAETVARMGRGVIRDTTLEFHRPERILSVGACRHEDQVVVHDVEEGGFWAEVPAIPGCATQGETMDELMRNLHEAIEGCLAVDVAAPKPGGKERIIEIAL
jgi:predicted RNase H-like HicB family nuclease